MRYKHGCKGTRLYRIWKAMRERCRNRNSKAYPNYGGRGITVCLEWDSFEEFKEWADRTGYSDELTIDRIDNNKGYTPDNCRWATRKEQNNNQRKNIKVVVDGEPTSLYDISIKSGIPYTTVYSRYRNGWSAEDLGKTQHHSANEHLVEFNGEMLCVSEVARRTGLSRSTVRAHYKGGDTSEV